VYQTQ